MPLVAANTVDQNNLLDVFKSWQHETITMGKTHGLSYPDRTFLEGKQSNSDLRQDNYPDFFFNNFVDTFFNLQKTVIFVIFGPFQIRLISYFWFEAIHFLIWLKFENFNDNFKTFFKTGLRILFILFSIHLSDLGYEQ